MNPGVALPHQSIVPIRRADPAGDSFIFTQFLDFASQEWEDRTGYGTSVSWPSVAGERAATGNAGMVQTLASTPYSIAYVGISFHGAIAQASLGTARLENQSGRFLLPTPETVSAAASMLDSRTPPDERLSLVFAPGAQSYPLINYEYVVVSKRQADGPRPRRYAAFCYGRCRSMAAIPDKYLNNVGFIALPDFIRGMSEHQIGLIGPGGAAAD